MSELKAIDVDKMADVRSLSGQFYRKSEADKVIAELKRMDTEHTLQIAKMNGYIHHLEDELRHSNHKRCLAMAKWCESEAYIHEHGSDYDEDLVAWFGKWHKRWLEIAEEPTWAKFLQLIHKEAK